MPRELSQEKLRENEKTPRESSLLRKFVSEEADREILLAKLDKGIEQKSKSIPARDGETYSSVLERMFPTMKASSIEILAHDTAGLNNNELLKAGDRFEILSDYGKKLLRESILKEIDTRQNPHAETKARSKFAPAYEQPMRHFKELILKEFAHPNKKSSDSATEAKTRIQTTNAGTDQNAATDQNAGTDHSTQAEPKTAELHLHDTTDNAQDNKLSRRQEESQELQTQTQDVFAEQSLNNFVDACHEFAKRSESMLFLSKWYDPDSNMYQWGEKRFQEAFQKSKESFQKVYQSIHDEEERNRIEKEWKGFLNRQKESLANSEKTFLWMN